MKKIICLLIVCLMVYTSKAQISSTPEHVYDSTIGFLVGSTKILNDTKYIFIHSNYNSHSDPNPNSITLYSSDHTLFKSITIPSSPVAGLSSEFVFGVSDSLFSLDNKISFGVQYTDYQFHDLITIFNEDGSNLFQADSMVTMDYDFGGTYVINRNTIINTTDGSKMVLRKRFSGSTSIYGLPGTYTGMKTPNIDNNQGYLDAFPNPAHEQTVLKYQLPENVNNGEIVLYNMNGQELKRYQIDRTFDNLLLDNSQLPSGNYLYQMVTAQGVSDGKKVIVIK